MTQWAKARLQGRRGASPLQPYRELARLWRKSVVDPQGTGPVYRSSPAAVAASLLLACLLVPIAGHAPAWPVGHDALVLLGLLALARFAVAAAAWDTGNGFSLQGASRDLAISVSVEAALVLALVAAALAGSTTDLRGMAVATAAADPRPSFWFMLFRPPASAAAAPPAYSGQLKRTTLPSHEQCAHHVRVAEPCGAEARGGARVPRYKNG